MAGRAYRRSRRGGSRIQAVPPWRVAHCRRLVREANALLVLGSSLTVMSGLRLVRQATEAGKPVAVAA